MQYLEKIVIKHFRSFHGGVGEPKVEIAELSHLNVFSGANDSGKSNILRALNLFFNHQVSPGVPFDIERDLSKIHKATSDEKAIAKRKQGRKDVRQKDLWVQIRVHFVKDTWGVLPQKFWVEKTWDRNGLRPRRTDIEENKDPNKTRAQEGQLTQFLNNIKFEYVPAVKDRQFFNFLFLKLQEYLFEKQDRKKENDFKKHSLGFNDILRIQTQRLFEEFKNNTKIQAEFSIPETLVDFFRTLSVKTENEISLFDRGDGIQARFIPDILNETSNNSRKKIIWGFEEPENSYEPLRCFELAQDFLKYSTDKQIFLTTHAFPFIALQGANVSAYRVKMANGVSRVGKIDWKQRSIRGLGFESDGEALEREVGLLETYARLSNHLGVVFKKRKNFVFVEDAKQQLYKIAWLKLRNKNFNENDFERIFENECNFQLYGKGGRSELRKLVDAPEITEWNDDKVICVFDFDDAYDHEFKGLNPPRWLEQEGSEDVCLLRRRSSHKYFSAITIPVPKSRNTYAKKNHTHNYLELEHLLEDSTLRAIDAFGGFEEPSGNLKITKIKGKSHLWEKLIELPSKDFSNFSPLFKRIDELFS